jgi:hypothetical protein
MLIVDPYRPDWAMGEWTDHLAFHIFNWTLSFLCIAAVNPLMDFVFGRQDLVGLSEILAERGRFVFGAALAVGTIVALVHRYIVYKGWDTQNVSVAQVEFLTNGIYPVGHPFVAGLHPFYFWRDLQNVTIEYQRKKVWITLQPSGNRLPVNLKLGSMQADLLLGALDKAETSCNSLLAVAMRAVNQQKAQGKSRGKVTVPVS